MLYSPQFACLSRQLLVRPCHAESVESHPPEGLVSAILPNERALLAIKLDPVRVRRLYPCHRPCPFATFGRPIRLYPYSITSVTGVKLFTEDIFKIFHPSVDLAYGR